LKKLPGNPFRLPGDQRIDDEGLPGELILPFQLPGDRRIDDEGLPGELMLVGNS
jgi:hypothetical protein